MKIKDYERMLDALQMTAIYVIREDNHKILYYNQRVKAVTPDVRKGMVCHELWSDTCANCPLLHIRNKQEARAVSYGGPFGKAVEITASRLLWDDTIPAFMITIAPYVEASNYIYHKVLRANLATDSYNVIKVDEEEIRELRDDMGSLSAWLKGVADKGYVYGEDVDRYRKFVQPERLREALQGETKMLSCAYRRKVGDRFRWHTLEIVPEYDYTEENPGIMLYVKDVHEMFREGLEREETNIRNQEIINSLGEMNFAIYVVDLQNGGVHVVQATDLIRSRIRTDIFLWDEVFRGEKKRYIAPEDQKGFQERLSLEALQSAWKRGEKKLTFVCRCYLRGGWRYVSTVAFLKGSEQQNAYAILAFQDVDEQTKKDMEHIQYDRRMAAIIRSRYSIMNTVDLETGNCERIFLRKETSGGRLEGDYDYHIRRALENTVVEADRQMFQDTFLLENLRRRAEQVQDFREEVCQYRQKGDPMIWVEEHVLYIRQGKKTVVNILGRDITAEKLAQEQALKEAREKASIINSLSSMFFATYYIDLEKDLFRAVTQKKNVGNTLGDERCYSQGIEVYAEKFVHPDSRKTYLESIQYERLCRDLSREHPVLACEYRMMPDEKGHSAWIRATVVLAEVTKDGYPKRALYVAQDVTESKRKEEQEQRALKEACEAANHANAAKSEFMSRMSHDIRTPMNAIIGMTAIAGRYLDDQDRVADCLGKITVSSRHLLSLINEVLDMSKIESGKIDLAEEDVNLSDLVDSLVTMIRPSVQAKNHNLDVRIVHVDHEHVVGDSMRIQQIFMNILGNAVKYTPEGGNIEMVIHEKPSHIPGYGCYEFVFRDDGIGMSEEFQEKLFEPFSRAEDSRVSKIEGTGLGMTIAKNIARKMNGDIAVKSELGKGTEFTVTLFFRIQDTDGPNTERLLELPVLVVDDDEAAGEMTCLILENIGMNGEYVLSGREAVERVWKRHQDDDDYFAVILDWKMPEMDGIQTARAIREKVGDEIPIIILSAYDWSSVEEEARQAGVNGFISKPLFKSRLVYLFNQLAGQEDEGEDGSEDAFCGQIPEGCRILLAEDNELNREIAEEIISQAGVAVESVENGREAVERFESKEEGYYGLILMDIQMPVMNGYEATRAIRKLPRPDAARIPIVAMTANAFAEDIQQSRLAGMNEHLTKPLNIDQLMRCLERWLKKKAD